MARIFTISSIFILGLTFHTNAQCIVADYRFTGNVLDSSGNQIHATLHGATLTTDRFDRPNHAYYFDGINDYIDTDHSFDLAIRSVSVWALIEDFNTERVVIEQDAHTLNNGSWDITFKQGVLSANAGGGGLLPLVTEPDTGVWYHLVIIRDQNEARSYVNGQLVLTDNIGSNGSVTYPNEEALIGVTRTEYSHFFKGKIDDVKIFDCALSDAQIDSLYNYEPGATDTTDTTQPDDPGEPKGIQPSSYEVNTVLYPNPVSSILSIDFPEIIDQAEISVVDVNGRTVLEQTVRAANHVEISMEALEPGNYLIEIQAQGKGTIRKQVVKQ